MAADNKPWFASWPCDVPKTIEYPEVPLHEILKKTAMAHPEKTAIAYRDREIGYRELDELSNKFASALASLNVKKGDRVALFLPNIPQFIIAYYGVLRVGAVVTAISPLHREREVEYQLNDAEAETIVTLDSLYPIVEKVWGKTPLKRAVLTSLEAFAAETEQKPNIHSFQHLLEKSTPNHSSVKINPSKDLAALQ